jgi:hypothetical protein
MSAFGTKKRGGDVALQMTFPEVKASFTALTDPEPYGYEESSAPERADPPVAHDLQQNYHEEKRKWANRNAMNWVHNNGRTRWLMNHNTYGFTQPRPVLGQRIFANPSLGNISDIYPARRTMSAGNSHTGDAPIKCSSTGLQGGILRTHQGQDYYKKLMSARIDQLNAIASAVPQGAEAPLANAGYPKVKSDDTEEVSDKAKLDLKSLLEQILTEYETNSNQADLTIPLQASLYKTIIDAQKLLFRLAVSFTRYDFEDATRYSKNILRLARSMIGAREQGDAPVQESELRNLKQIIVIASYIDRMSKYVNYSLEEKKLASANIIKDLGASKVAPSETLPPTGIAIEGFRNIWDEKKEAGIKKLNLKLTRELAKLLDIRTRVGTSFVSKDKLDTKIIDEIKLIEKADKEFEEEDPTKVGLADLRRLCRWWGLDPEGSEEDLFALLAGYYGFEGSEDEEEEEPVDERNKVVPADAPPPPPSGPTNLPTPTPLGSGRFMVGKIKGRARLNPEDFSDKAKFDVDNRVRFGDRQGAYYGEEIGEQVPEMPVPVPIEPDGTYIHPGSGYTRPIFPKMTVQKKPSNTMKIIKEPAPPVFQNSKNPPQLGIFKAERMTMPKAVAPIRPPFSYTGGKSILGLTKKNLPTTHEGYVKLAEVLRQNGHNIRVNSGAQLKNIRANFIRRLGL